jgi:hypothetical protein
MSCANLAGTGFPLAEVVLSGAALTVTGVLLLVWSRNRHGGNASLLVLLLAVVAIWATARSSPARAADVVCPPVGQADLVITQTSVNVGLAPGKAPELLTGVVRNDGTRSTLVTAITVRIASVSKAPNAPAGTCTPEDYVLLDTTMPVGKTLGPGDSAAFAGAHIGFNDKSVNQDACQQATVHLEYTSS